MMGRIADLRNVLSQNWKTAALAGGVAAGGLATGLAFGANTRDAGQTEPQQVDDQILAEVQLGQAAVAQQQMQPQVQEPVVIYQEPEVNPMVSGLSEEQQLEQRFKLVKQKRKAEEDYQEQMAAIEAQQMMYGGL